MTGEEQTGKPMVWKPHIFVCGVLVEAAAAVYSLARRGYYVTFANGDRVWVDPEEIVWQRVMVFDEDRL